MPGSSSRPPQLRALRHQIKSWPLGERMWPDEIFQVQADMTQLSDFIERSVPLLSRPAYKAALRHPRRCVQNSLDNIVYKFSTEAGRGAFPHLTCPDYATVSWDLVKPWVLEKSGPQALYDLAYNMRLEVLREAIRLRPAQDTLSDVYITLDRYKSNAPPTLPHVNIHTDWADVVLARKFDPENEKAVLGQIFELVKSSGLQSDSGRQALILVSGRTTMAHPDVIQRAKGQLDALLVHGAPWQEVFDMLPLPAQAYIKDHPAVRRAQLMDITHNPQRSPAPSRNKPSL